MNIVYKVERSRIERSGFFDFDVCVINKNIMNRILHKKLAEEKKKKNDL